MSTSHKSHSKHPPQVHPFMLAFCGFSGSGKTTLITGIIRTLESRYSIAFIKSDAHRFEMDKEGKDTYKARAAGAEQILINNQGSHAAISGVPLDPWDVRSGLESSDITLVEGYKNSDLPKILVLDNKGELLEKFHQGDFKNVQGIIYPGDSAPLADGLPLFQRDDVKGISDFVEKLFRDKVKSMPLYGLVLDGGKSTRMGKDKGTLEYYGMPHNLFLAQQLGNFCDGVFISRRPDQLTTGEYHGYPEIPDAFSGMGPLGGILSAQKAHPGAAFLVLACDLPFVNGQILEKLIRSRFPFKFATAFKSAESDLPEPLCAIYEPKFYSRALKFCGQGITCPRKVLINSRTEILDQGEENILYNANSPDDLEHTLETLARTRS